ncbi:hypothetical protein BX666DRAFT_1933648 [Dichotomocladium elegans]|nr:hypothetical protein BX666DRAFT_1933648 [Dichotomocladium elegans]
MLPWSNKTGSSSGSSTIQRDESIANSNQYKTPESNETESSRFRSTPAAPSSHDHAFDTFTNSASHQSQHITRPFHDSRELSRQQQQHAPPAAPLQQAADGADVLDLLGSADYADAVYGDDLLQDSSTYRSYHHQHDREHSLAEYQQQQQQRHEWTELLATEDIVEYLRNVKYTDDIYGAPPAVQALIREAQQEIAAATVPENQHQRVNGAVARLTMVRDHLMGRAHGQVDLAAKQAQQLQDGDWDAIFAKGTSL